MTDLWERGDGDAQAELIKSAVHKIVGELEAEMTDALGREHCANGATPGTGYRNGHRHLAPGTKEDTASSKDWQAICTIALPHRLSDVSARIRRQGLVAIETAWERGGLVLSTRPPSPRRAGLEARAQLVVVL